MLLKLKREFSLMFKSLKDEGDWKGDLELGFC